MLVEAHRTDVSETPRASPEPEDRQIEALNPKPAFSNPNPTLSTPNPKTLNPKPPTPLLGMGLIP